MNNSWKYRKSLYIVLGLLSLVLAYIGVVMPGIPGTPFIILTAWFFVRSSDGLYKWLLKNKLFARIINKFQEEELSTKVKLFLLIPVWISFVVADILFIKNWWGHVILIILILAYTILILKLKRIKM